MIEKLKKYKKLLLVIILLIIAFITSYFVNLKEDDFTVTNKTKIANADTCSQLSDGNTYCCSTVSSEALTISKNKSDACSKSSTSLLCTTYTEKYNVVRKFQCEECMTPPAGYSSYVYNNNGVCSIGKYIGACGDGYDSHNSFSSGTVLGYSGGHPITRVTVSGSVAFCIQPDVWYSKCGIYSTSGVSVSVSDNIARVVWAFNHSNQSDSAYMAAQSMIWGTNIVGDAEEIYRNMPENSSTSTTHSVSLNTHEVTVNLGDSISVNDNNGNLSSYSSHFNVTNSNGLNVNRSGNTLSITTNNIYPLTKTVKVNVSGSNPEVSGTSGGSISYTKYSASNSQDFVAFSSGTLGNINYTYYSGDTLTIKIATGSLEVRKIDSFDRPVTEGTKFKIYYANEDGTIYKEFATEDGKTEFSTNTDGYVIVKNLPSGGKFDDGTPIGKYVVKEISTTSEYTLNGREYVVDITQGKTSTVTIQNANVLHEGGVTVYKHDEWNRAIEGGTTFRIYYATTDCDKATETGTLNDVTYCKKEVFVNLADKKEGKTESVYTIDDEGYLTVSSELPVGGQFADHTPVGVYILQEYQPSDAYELNTNLYVFDVGDPESTLEIDVEDENVKGDLKINKLDEYGRTTTPDISFTLAYAYQNEYGEWADYQDFISAKDYKDGKTEATVFTTGEDGILEILNTLPVGGTFPDTDIEIGNYILHEISTTNAYVLNEKPMLINLTGHEKTEYDYLNDLRTVSFTILKQDEEENYRELNDAEFTVYDISDVIDLEMNYDNVEDCTAHDGLWDEENSTCNYKTETVTYTKLGKVIDMETILKAIYPEASEVIDGKPIKYELSQDSLATITPFGALTSEKVGNLTVKVLGGAYELYVSDGDATVYDDENFNPYDLKFYSKGTDGVYYQMDTKSVEITNEEIPDFTEIGEYELSYKVTSSRNVVYEFTRKIEVIKDNRHLCLDTELVDAENNKIYRYLDTKEVCEEKDAVEIIPSHNTSIVPVVVASQEIKEDWNNKELYTLEIKIVQDDDLIITENSEIKELLPIFKGKTGHGYFQLVDLDNHNLYIKVDEMLLYKDEELTTPVLKYTGSSEFGVYDLNESNWETYTPVESSTEDSAGTVEDSTEDEPENLNIYYYKNSRGQAVRVELVETSEKGVLNIPNLKHSRTYLLSESALPEGYDFSESTNSAYIFNTYDYTEEEIEHFTTLYNKLRRIDMILAKTNGSDTKLSGAIFDVYETYEEGEDFNIITHTKETLGLASLEDGREYYKEALGEVSAEGTCDEYSLLPDVGETVAFDENGDLLDNTKPTYAPYVDEETMYGIDNPLDITLYKKVKDKYYKLEEASLEKDADYQENNYIITADKELYVKQAFKGTCHKIYNPDTVQRKYLGRYITGGIYEAYVLDDDGNIKLLNDVSGNLITTYKETLEGEVEIAIDKNFENIVKTVKLNNGVLETTLNDGTYYTRLKQPTRLIDIEETDDAEDTKEDVTPAKKEEVIPYEELDPQYQVVNKYYVSKGKFTLENIKYFHNLLYVEVKAPNGYNINNTNTAVTPTAPYGVDYMENVVVNNINNVVLTSSKTGVNTYKTWDTGKACVAH